MTTPAFAPPTTISQVLQRAPDSATLFIARGTDCLGCLLAPFCTLEEMSLHYGVDLARFLEELDPLGAQG